MAKTIRPFIDLLRKTLFATTALMFAAYLLPATEVAGISLPVAHAAGVNVWWPAQNAELDGTQPFKAVVDGMPLSDYAMYWQVDGGNLVKMQDSQADYPHKEAQVDLASWNWSATGTYSVNFIAKDNAGSEIGRTSVAIKHGTPPSQAPITVAKTAAPATTATAQGTAYPLSVSLPVASPVKATAASAAKTITSYPLTNPTAPVTVTSSSPTQGPTGTKAETARLAIRVWYPTANANLTGVQPIKAATDLALTSYKMYWQIDGGALTEMYDSYDGGAHKENKIDFTNWRWKGNNPYAIRVIAKNLEGAVIGQIDVPVYANANQAAQTTQTTQTVAPAQTAPIATPAQTTAGSGGLYVDPNNPALAQAKTWTSSRPADAAIMAKIGSQSSGVWLGGWNADVQSDVSKAVASAKSQNATATFVAYNIPGRDCGQYSAGGLSGKDAYLSWIKKISSGIGSGNAIVILEPDALSLTDCLSEAGKADRYATLSEAADILASNPGTKVYLDAGHSGWINSSEMASRLSKAGVSKAAGFSLNVSNFVTTADNVAYGTEISKATGGKHFVVDTSRNGSGSNGEWCNPSGRSLGQAPTLSTGNSLVDAYLWAKKPGESDGNCNGGPSAGTWWPEYALDLAKRSGY